MTIFGEKRWPSKLYFHLAASWTRTETEVVTKGFFKTKLPRGRESGALSGLRNSSCKVWEHCPCPKDSRLQEASAHCPPPSPPPSPRPQGSERPLPTLKAFFLHLSVIYMSLPHLQHARTLQKRAASTEQLRTVVHLCPSDSEEHICAHIPLSLDLPLEICFPWSTLSAMLSASL